MVGTLAKEKRETSGFGARLKALRAAAQLTQEKLAELTGMTVGNVGRLESGGRQPSWETVVRLAKALGVEPNDFLSEDE